MQPEKNGLLEEYVLVDFENLKITGLPALQENQHVLIFTGENQNKIDFNLVKDSQKYGERVNWIKIDGNGKNALDFHIAFYLGEMASKNKTAYFSVLSKDKGFDPLIKHLIAIGINCKRIDELKKLPPKKQERAPKKQEDEESFYLRMVDALRKLDQKTRPKRITSLKAFLGSKGKLEDANKEKIVERLVQENVIKLDDKKVVYQAV